MSRTKRTLTVALWCLVVVSLIGVLAMQRWEARAAQARAADRARLAQGEMLELRPDGKLVPATQRADIAFTAPSFTLTDQASATFDSKALEGKVWTAMFFFSECKGFCPGMIGRIESLQAAASDPRVSFVSFSVDPERDTPERLAQYAAKAKADPARWHMLTGPVSEMKRVAQAFYLPFDKPMDHSTKIMLVDGRGTVRGYFDSQDDAEMKRLSEAVTRLLAEGSSTAAGGTR